ncbi:hypothetical protein [Klebsiella sp. BIGb0407]|uniref:hypothetical protein n=1 Tax=Klebsiella sp. BIGb0407 TaxID=2940603 RepID=UPI002167F8EF|nr:hypothetical protein [Klebsiella sp. BIGb0407]MCS3433690.1 hypothetical protein [Klebsiella sp. BIGb0407]
MKLTLNEVMGSLRVVCALDGYELHSPAGVAYYDECGVRNRVNGVPEYFPLSLSVHTATDNKLGKLGGKDGGVSMGWNIQLQANALIATTTEQAIQATARAESLASLTAKSEANSADIELIRASILGLLKEGIQSTIKSLIKSEKNPGGLLYRR